MRRLFLLLPVLALLSPLGALAVNNDEPFAVEACSGPIAAKAGGDVSIAFDYKVFKDHFIYRDMSSVSVTDAGGVTFSEAAFPKGKVKFDKVSESEREIFEHDFSVTLAGKVPEGATGTLPVKVEVKWQGCNKPENYCLFPETRELTCNVSLDGDGASDASADPADAGAEDEVEEQPSTLAGTAGKGPGGSAMMANSSGKAATEACAGQAGADGAGAGGLIAWVEGILAGGSGGSFLAFLALVFLGGLASSLTPCVYPMIPITVSVIGASADQGRLKSFTLSLVYVLGIAATYTALGLFAAYSGDLFGGMMQNPWVIGGVSVVFFLLAAAMFGFYEFALPSSVTTKASMVGGGGYGGAFIVGTVAGVVAAPCTGPIVALLLVKIASDYTMLQGVAIMIAYSLGLGQIFLAIGTFAGVMGSMARPGAWMVEVKHVFGVVMTGVGIWYLGQILPGNVMMVLWTGFVLIAAFEVAGRMEAIKGPRNMARVAAAALVLVGGLAYVLMPSDDAPDEVASAETAVTWGSDHDDGAALSSSAGKPMIVDFTADWCAACKELEHFTYTDPAVASCSAEFVPVMIDGTEKTPEFERLRKKYKVRGLPAVYFVCPEGGVVDELTLKGFEPADQFLAKMNKALAACSTESADAG